MQTIDDRARDAARDLRASVSRVPSPHAARTRRRVIGPVVAVAAAVLVVAGTIVATHDGEAEVGDDDTVVPATVVLPDSVTSETAGSGPDGTSWSVRMDGDTRVCWRTGDTLPEQCLDATAIQPGTVVGVDGMRLVLRTAPESVVGAVLMPSSDRSAARLIASGATRVVVVPVSWQTPSVVVVGEAADGSEVFRDTVGAPAIPDLVGIGIDDATAQLRALGLSNRMYDLTGETAVRFQHPAPGARDLAIATVDLVTCCDNGGLAFAMPRHGRMESFTPSQDGRACYKLTTDEFCFSAGTDAAARLDTLGDERLLVVPIDPGPTRPIVRFDDGLPIRAGGLDSDVREVATIFIPAGTQRVTIETASGVQRIDAAPVPNLVGMTLDEAVATLSERFVISATGSSSGVVTAQSVRPGWTDLSILRVALTVSAG